MSEERDSINEFEPGNTVVINVFCSCLNREKGIEIELESSWDGSRNIIQVAVDISNHVCSTTVTPLSEVFE